MKLRNHPFLTAFWLFVSSCSVFSQSSLYFDRPSFIAAAHAIPGNFQTISNFPFVNAPEYAVSDLTFRGGFLVGVPNGVLWNFDGSNPGLRIQFANGARAFGADFSSALSSHGFSSFPAMVSLDTGETFQFIAPTDPNFAFFGFVSPVPVLSMTFSDGGLLGPGQLHEELLRNIVVVTIPEPNTTATITLGILLLGARLWRRS